MHRQTEGAPDGELALVILEDAHDAKGVFADIVHALQEAADLVHDLVVDGVLVIVLVVAPPDGEALWVEALKVLNTHEIMTSDSARSYGAAVSPTTHGRI